jgi:hypothetical protein
LHEVLQNPDLKLLLTWTARKRMLREAALGIHYLHNERIIHMVDRYIEIILVVLFDISESLIGDGPLMTPLMIGHQTSELFSDK